LNTTVFCGNLEWKTIPRQDNASDGAVNSLQKKLLALRGSPKMRRLPQQQRTLLLNDNSNEKGENMGKATHDLKNEHEAILHVLTIVDKMLSADAKQDAEMFKFGTELVYFLKIFADKCHHGKEENYLFDELIARGIPNEGGPIGVMLQEHRLGREYIAHMDQALSSKDMADFKANAIRYRDLLRNHIQKENDALFVMADKVLDYAQQDDLFQKFTEFEETVIGHGIHEQLHAMINQWEAEFSL
jgi:hemerythrin-like domain-containing protein